MHASLLFWHTMGRLNTGLMCGDKDLSCCRQYVGESHQRASQRRQTPQGRSGNSSKLPSSFLDLKTGAFICFGFAAL